MVYDSSKEWVSEPGTVHIMGVGQEPYSINETNEKEQTVGGTVEHKKEPASTGQPATDPAEAPSKEPTESADQKDAAKATLATSVGKLQSIDRQWLIYGIVALVALKVVGEVL